MVEQGEDGQKKAPTYEWSTSDFMRNRLRFSIFKNNAI
jgi:hypothetical protein